MRALVLGAFLCASFGLIANAAETPPAAKGTSHNTKRLVCHWVTADRT
jgi:hypothetical protein